MSTDISSSREFFKKMFLDLLEEDREFRYALMGLLGFREILDRITRLEERFAKLEEEFLELRKAQQRLEERFAKLEERFAELEKRFVELEERFVKLEERVARLEERVARLEERFLRLEERVAKLEEELVELRKAHLRLEESVERLSRAVQELAARVTAISHRYGLATEEAFREAVRYLVEDLLEEYTVKKWVHYDNEGLVFGYPSVVEVDLLVKNNVHILVEYKAMADRSDVAELYRIGRLYEKATGVKPRLLLVAPVYRRRARELAEKLGVEIRGEQVD